MTVQVATEALIAEARRRAVFGRQQAADGRWPDSGDADFMDSVADALEAATKGATVVTEYGIDYGDEVDEGFKSSAEAREYLARLIRQTSEEDLHLYDPASISVRTTTTIQTAWEPVGEVATNDQ